MSSAYVQLFLLSCPGPVSGCMKTPRVRERELLYMLNVIIDEGSKGRKKGGERKEIVRGNTELF